MRTAEVGEWPNVSSCAAARCPTFMTDRTRRRSWRSLVQPPRDSPVHDGLPAYHEHHYAEGYGSILELMLLHSSKTHLFSRPRTIFSTTFAGLPLSAACLCSSTASASRTISGTAKCGMRSSESAQWSALRWPATPWIRINAGVRHEGDAWPGRAS